MRKVYTVLSASAILLGMLVGSAIAKDLPSATKAPVIDANIDATEWAGAYVSTISSALVDKGECAVFVGALKDNPSSGIVRLMWDSKYIYAAGEYTDVSLFFLVEPSGVGLMAESPTNVQDGFQLVFDAGGDGESNVDTDIIDFTMTPDGKKGMYWQHWGGSPRREFPNIKMAAVKTAKGFNFEAAIPWSDFEQDYVPKKGDILGNTNCYDDVDDGGAQIVVGDAEAAPWSGPAALNKLTLK